MILRKSYGAALTTRLKYTLGRLAPFPARARQFYEMVNSDRYAFHESRQPSAQIAELNRYVTDVGPVYRANLSKLRGEGRIEDSSQFYPYRYIAEQLGRPCAVCDIGAFYASAAHQYVATTPGAQACALDFGDMRALNSDLAHDRLHVHSGYPLETLERMAGDGATDLFDYAVFVRTATLMNPNELRSYMTVLRRLAKGVVFLEVAKTTSLMSSALDIAALPIDQPARIFNGMRIHNYPAILEAHGFRVADARVLPPSTFRASGSQDAFVPDHYFAFAAGVREPTTAART